MDPAVPRKDDRVEEALVLLSEYIDSVSMVPEVDAVLEILR